MELYSILSESNTDLRQPVGLEAQLLKDEALDSEVGQSMLQLLQVYLTWSSPGAACHCATSDWLLSLGCAVPVSRQNSQALWLFLWFVGSACITLSILVFRHQDGLLRKS